MSQSRLFQLWNGKLKVFIQQNYCDKQKESNSTVWKNFFVSTHESMCTFWFKSTRFFSLPFPSCMRGWGQQWEEASRFLTRYFTQKQFSLIFTWRLRWYVGKVKASLYSVFSFFLILPNLVWFQIVLMDGCTNFILLDDRYLIITW